MLVLNEDGISSFKILQDSPNYHLLLTPHHDSEQVSSTARKVSTDRGKSL